MFSGLLQPMHLIVILVVVLVLYGPGKLANLGHDLGKSIREFKSAMEEQHVEASQITAEAKPAAHPAPRAVDLAEEVRPADKV